MTNFRTENHCRVSERGSGSLSCITWNMERGIDVKSTNGSQRFALIEKVLRLNESSIMKNCQPQGKFAHQANEWFRLHLFDYSFSPSLCTRVNCYIEAFHDKTLYTVGVCVRSYFIHADCDTRRWYPYNRHECDSPERENDIDRFFFCIAFLLVAQVHRDLCGLITLVTSITMKS